MKPLVVSCPFGNYYCFLRVVTGADFTPTLGTFTWLPRGFFDKPYGGRFLRVLLSVRYSFMFKSWRNRIGLKNPGIRQLQNKVLRSKKCTVHDKIISIYGWTDREWKNLLESIRKMEPLAVELNLSCPNVKKPPFTSDLFKRAMDTGVKVIGKIPPVNYRHLVEMAYKEGVRTFHATNTLPTPFGGMSGKSLKPIALDAVSYLRDNYPDLYIIGGGGITRKEDAKEFREVGANSVAIGTMLFNPLNWLYVKELV